MITATDDMFLENIKHFKTFKKHIVNFCNQETLDLNLL